MTTRALRATVGGLKGAGLTVVLNGPDTPG